MGEGIRRGDILRRTLVSVVVFWDTTLIHQCWKLGYEQLKEMQRSGVLGVDYQAVSVGPRSSILNCDFQRGL